MLAVGLQFTVQNPNELYVLVSSALPTLFGVLRRFQHCTGHITTGSYPSNEKVVRGNQYIQFTRVLYCKLPTNGKQLPAFPLEAMTGIETRPQRSHIDIKFICVSCMLIGHVPQSLSSSRNCVIAPCLLCELYLQLALLLIHILLQGNPCYFTITCMFCIQFIPIYIPGSCYDKSCLKRCKKKGKSSKDNSYEWLQVK